MNRLLLIVFLFSIKLYSQDFEGRIEYTTSYKVLSDKENEANLKKDLGTKTLFVTKNGFCKEIINADYGNFYLYNPKENRLYFTDKFTPGTLYYYKGQKEPNKKATYKVVKNAGKVLGHSCDKLIYTTENYEIAYYYSKDLKYDPKYVKDFSYMNKDKKLGIMKAIFLKQVMTTKNFVATIEATKISFEKINDAEFIKPQYDTLKEQ